MNERNLQRGELLATLFEHVERDHRFESTDNEQSVDVVLGQSSRYSRKIDIRESSIRSQF